MTRHSSLVLWWWVGLAGHWRLARPAHAYPLVNTADRERAKQLCLWWTVPIVEAREGEDPGFMPPVDPPEAYWIENFDAERAAMMAEFARADARSHRLISMRAIYERCAVHLDEEAQRLKRAV